MEPDQATQKPSDVRDAFLVVREGTSWRDVFRLSPAQVMTIGRATTNRIVLHDELCSRNHCELYRNGPSWILRDLGSRNGTMVNNGPVVGERELESGDLIQIGPYELGFTFDLSQPFGAPEATADVNGSDTAFAVEVIGEQAQGAPEIIHRTRNSPYRTPQTDLTRVRDRAHQELASLYRLALDMGAAPGAKELAEVVLAGLNSGIKFDIGAVLLLPKAVQQDAKASQLTVVAYTAKGESPYHKVSSYLSTQVLSTREAILARDVRKDTRLAQRDDLGELQAESVICAPIQLGPLVHGLIHLYSTNPNRPFQPEDLEFTIAVADQMAVALRNLKEKESLASGLDRIRTDYETLRQQLVTASEIVGQSPEVDDLRQTIVRIAPTDATVLIRGESGVGKELVARAIHFKSSRHSRPFGTMNCAALAESLLESELFGHEKGSFTGATERKLGKFEQAHRGTLFLDEVGEMSLAIQAKFLRVLEGHPFERVGGRNPVQVDVRVVAATNRNLEREVERGTFRKDLYFRLHVVEIVVTPLRKRRTDIPILAEHFLARSARKTGRQVGSFSRGALEAMAAYGWPGNVRELQNVVERAVILCPGDQVREEDIRLTALRTPPSDPTIGVMDNRPGSYREVSLTVLEKEHILATLEHTNGNMTRTAEILGIERSTLYQKLKRFDAQRRSF
jgi:two-component system, NtrC family, response regulator HydG